MRSKLSRIGGALLALLLQFSLSASAAPLEAEGVAAVSAGNVAQARQAAIRDALEQLGLRSGARVGVAAGASARGGKTFESSRVQPAADFERYTVLREWQTGQLLHVRIAVKDEDARPRGSVNLGYKKKIVVTPFHVRRSPQLDDVDDIAIRLPQELLRRTSASGKFLGKESPYVISPGATGPSTDTAAVSALGPLLPGEIT